LWLNLSNIRRGRSRKIPENLKEMPEKRGYAARNFHLRVMKPSHLAGCSFVHDAQGCGLKIQRARDGKD
jgi:hypothetical protein